MKPRILVVDDDPSILEINATILEMADCVIVTATDGREALALLAEDTFDLVVSDLYMPDIDGLELIGHIRKLPRPVPIIMISGGGAYGFDLSAAARNLGAVATLAKPVKATDLLNAVAAILCTGRENDPSNPYRDFCSDSVQVGTSSENRPLTKPGMTAEAGLT